MTSWTKLYLWVKGWKFPTWVNDMFEWLWEDIIYPCLKQVGEEGLEFIRAEVIKQSSLDIPGHQKLRNVRMAFREHMQAIVITDRLLDLAIQIIVNKLTKQRFI